jgi:hypothetical protein
MWVLPDCGHAWNRINSIGCSDWDVEAHFTAGAVCCCAALEPCRGRLQGNQLLLHLKMLHTACLYYRLRQLL